MLRHRWIGVLVAVLLSIWTAVAAAAPFAYITNSAAPGTISVLDTATNTVAATIELPNGSIPWGVALNPAGTRLYVTNFGNGALFVFDTATNDMRANIPLTARQPIGVAVNPAGTRVYITHFQVSGFLGAVSVVDATNNTRLTTVNMGLLPNGVTVHPAGTYVYVATLSGVLVLDPDTLAVQTTIPVGSRPFGLAFNESGSRLYVSNQGSNTVTVVNGADHSFVAEPAVGLSPQGIAVSPDGSRVYVANRVSGSVSVINTSDNTVADIPVGLAPYGVSVGPGGRFVYVANNGNSSVSIIDTTDSPPTVSSVQVGGMPVAFGNFIQPVTSVATAMTLEVNPSEVIVGSSNPVTARATLTRRDSGAPVSGASIAFSLDGGTSSAVTTDGSGVASWLVNPAPLDIGPHTFRAAFAEATIGGMRFEGSSATRGFRVIYQWGGWKPPVAGGGALNPANAGSTISMRWTMMDANGNPIRSLDAVVGIDTALIACAGDGIAEVSAAAGTGGNGLHMDGASQQFQFNWKTDKSWAGQCRAFIVRLTDGTTRMAKFHFR